MPFAGPARHTLYSAAAVLTVLAIAGVTVAFSTAGASASAPAGAAPPATAPPAPSSTSSTTPSTTTSTSTSTTVRPKPVTTTAKPRPTVPATTAATAPPTTSPAPAAVLPGNFTPEERCANARRWVAEHGLALPAGWGYRCPGQALENGSPRWGIACWNCNGDGQSWIAIDIGRIGASDKALRYVIAHETCHAIEYMTLGISTELTADLCAATHGAPRP